jgi:hypothetical protein
MAGTAGFLTGRRRIAVAFASAALALCASATAQEGGADSAESSSDGTALRAEIEKLRADLDEITRSGEVLGRRIEGVRAPTRAAVEDYLEARGITGLAWTDRELTPLDQIVRRGMVGADIRTRYELWDDLVDLDGDAGDTVDHYEIRARIAFGFALVEGPEVEVELQGLMGQGGIVVDSALPGGPVVPPPLGSPGFDPVFGLEGLDPDEALALRRAEVRLPAFNLGGRLAHVPAMLSVGRQEVAFGRGFFLGTDDRGVGITWDALRLWGDSGAGGRVDVFAGRAAIGKRVIAAHIAGPIDPDAADPEIGILGVRGEARGLLPDSMLAAYYVLADVGAVASTAPEFVDIPPAKVNTFGVEAGLDLTTTARLRFDGAFQWGDFGAQEIRDSAAAALEVEFGGEGSRVVGSVYTAYGTGDRASSAAYEAFIPLAQDREIWDDIGLLSSRNMVLWGVKLAARTALEAEAGVRFTQAFAPREESPAGFFLRPATAGAGNRIGEIVSVYAEWPLFGQEGSRLRIAYAHFVPGDFFADASDALMFQIEARFGF